MALTIRASSFFVKRYLKITDVGVEFMEAAAMGGRRRFRFGQIDHILMSPSQILSFQVGQEIFSLQTKPNKPKHQRAIQELLRAVGAAHAPAFGFPVV